MRIGEMLSLGLRYAMFGCLAAVTVLLVFLAGYKFIYKNLMHGEGQLEARKAVWLFIFVIYAAVLLGATFFSRDVFYSGSRLVPLFASYREAWFLGRLSNFINIAANILLFMPFGFLIPLGIVRMRSFMKTGLVGLGVTLSIELVQTVTGLGIFECDDILNNLVGTMIGYGFFVLAFRIFGKEERKKNAFEIFICQLPLILTIVAFATIFIVYESRELGNLAIHYVTKIPKEQFEIISEIQPEKDAGKAYVYQVKEYSLAETGELAKKIFEKTGGVINENATDIYESTVFYEGSGKHISIEYKGGAYEYLDWDAILPKAEQQPAMKTDATREEIENALLRLDIRIPQGSTFKNTRDGQYYFYSDRLEADGVTYDGFLNCECMADGSIGRVSNRIYECSAYKEYDIISEQQALEKLKSGEFLFYTAEDGKVVFTVHDIYLKYLTDSKSFYQPVYNFEVTAEGGNYNLMVPALKE